MNPEPTVQAPLVPQQEEITVFAETNFRNRRIPFGIKRRDRRQHMYVIGKTGMGKTTFLENLAAQDLQRGNGVGIVDPHGEFAEKMLDVIPMSRTNDVIYFNPADLNYPIAFNVMEKVDPEYRHLVASGLVGVFKKLWAETWGPRLEYVLRNAILALLEYPGSTLLSIMRMLTDKDFRKKVIAYIKDPVVKAFWTDEFQKYPDRFMAEAVAPIQNKVGQFITSPLIRNIIGQTKSAVDMREVMDQGKILIMNLSKGRIGEDNSALLGAMLITKIQLAAMSRVDVPESERRDFYLYVDEFQNFATESFATILSEARKYRLNLVLAHQYITQMSETVRDAVFGNVGTMICFRIGAADAEFLEKEFQPELTADDLVNLGFPNVYLKLLIDGVASRPFSATTLPPIAKSEVSNKEVIIRVSRERYASDREEVEDKIARWSGMVEESAERADMRGGASLPRRSDTSAAHEPRDTAPSAPPRRGGEDERRSGRREPRGGRRELRDKAPQIHSEPKILDDGSKKVSLAQALKQTPAPLQPAHDSGGEKKRKEVNLEELRQLLTDVTKGGEEQRS